eukprot:TRINITY_DN74416_c0_g1_i1.p1 TRINITY_DN74416_c0_g1~~TRINITY_DN74416_c0_g1_i1.p1  ORF type:complete len:736 (-),score=146.93 TRINITY_DN74416_c0_g1_i1:67-2199(-)
MQAAIRAGRAVVDQNVDVKQAESQNIVLQEMDRLQARIQIDVDHHAQQLAAVEQRLHAKVRSLESSLRRAVPQPDANSTTASGRGGQHRHGKTDGGDAQSIEAHLADKVNELKRELDDQLVDGFKSLQVRIDAESAQSGDISRRLESDVQRLQGTLQQHVRQEVEVLLRDAEVRMRSQLRTVSERVAAAEAQARDQFTSGRLYEEKLGVLEQNMKDLTVNGEVGQKDQRTFEARTNVILSKFESYIHDQLSSKISQLELDFQQRLNVEVEALQGIMEDRVATSTLTVEQKLSHAADRNVESLTQMEGQILAELCVLENGFADRVVQSVASSEQRLRDEQVERDARLGSHFDDRLDREMSAVEGIIDDRLTRSKGFIEGELLRELEDRGEEVAEKVASLCLRLDHLTDFCADEDEAMNEEPGDDVAEDGPHAELALIVRHHQEVLEAERGASIRREKLDEAERQMRQRGDDVDAREARLASRLDSLGLAKQPPISQSGNGEELKSALREAHVANDRIIGLGSVSSKGLPFERPISGFGDPGALATDFKTSSRPSTPQPPVKWNSSLSRSDAISLGPPSSQLAARTCGRSRRTDAGAVDARAHPSSQGVSASSQDVSSHRYLTEARTKAVDEMPRPSSAPLKGHCNDVGGDGIWKLVPLSPRALPRSFGSSTQAPVPALHVYDGAGLFDDSPLLLPKPSPSRGRPLRWYDSA